MNKSWTILVLLALTWAFSSVNMTGAEPHTKDCPDSRVNDNGTVPFDANRGNEVPAYQVSIRLIQKMPDGQKAVLCEPNLVVLENRTAAFNCGDTKEAPESIQLSEPLSCGTKVNLLLFRNKGRLFVDLKGSVTNPSCTDSEGVRLTTIGLRIVEPVTPGKPIVMPQGNDLRWELLVQAIRPNEQSSLQKHDGRKPDTAGGRVIMGGVEPRIIVQEEDGEERLGAVLP